MRLVLAAPYPYDPSSLSGGVMHVAYIMAQSLSRVPGVELSVVTSTKSVTRDEVREEDGYTVHFLASRRRRLVPNLFRDVVTVQRKLEMLRPEVVQSHHACATWGATRAGIPVVPTVHGIVHHEAKLARNWYTKLRYSVHMFVDSRGLPKVKHAIAICPYAADAYRERTEAKFHLVEVPVEDIFFETSGPSDPERLLYAGAVGERKNLMTLLRSVALLKERGTDVELVVCGNETEPDYAAMCRAFIAESGIGDRVRLVGLIRREEMPEYMEQAGIFVLPSRQETAPGVVCQAMAVGVPVVASNAGGTPFLVDDGGTGFICDSEDHTAFADCIERLILDRTLWRQMSEKARSDAQQRFRKDIVASKTVDVCKLALAEHKGIVRENVPV